MSDRLGTVVEVIGAVVDIEFPRDHVPKVNDALIQVDHDRVFEVQQQLGDGVVRTIAMGTTDGLKRGTQARNTGEPIKVPVGEKTSGRIMDVLGRAIDGLGPIETDEFWSIHRKPPSYEDQAGSQEILETGIKVID